MDFTKCVTLVGALLLLGVCLPSEACKCLIVDHLQWHFCRSEAVIKAIFINESQRATTSNTSNVRIGYDSQTLKVLKGDPALQDSTFIDSHMARTSCKYSHPKGGKGIPYMVPGPIINGSIGVGGCKFPKPWSELTAEQITGLEGAYQPGCGTCDIITYSSASSDPGTDKCILQKTGDVDFKNQQEKQACLRNEEGKCAWTTIQ